MTKNTMEFYDKNGRALEPFDIVKMFHFTGARRKKNYMYKQVLGRHPKNGVFIKLSHLNAKDEYFHLKCNNKINLGYEIVQGFGVDGIPFEDRARELLLPKVEIFDD